ncbi:HAMP domain-containing sensor histidine kinase [Limosilactobacillus reuteri]|uniref:HAMP domain-containing sensor histidine kinase n=1 Tax=Limosilactobacillus reuteri TaxID=1598 RepID=UPI00128E917F|nr:HAMP domain-containing histidine kinase [Limosilactobacillus reuteri]MQB70323.1 two-component sensor histidine kinase [Limosilactobacillus reuteri]MQB78261.1 two-component sensor histidine kinase [Limosilactobacillus reuteri]MQB83627.1 two-component sensor histidine kinase [Limosilactobacillus reuteri]MQB96716.1 two-component sensor histidine kinase [Limosilactobacillus reuteri]MQC00417.1 two-component sensor histidine kinase [Limosilactobacillus reuteri]
MKQKDEGRFVSLKIKWAAGTALGSLIIFCIVAMALFSAFTQNLFHQERQLLNQGMTNISTQLSTVDKPLTKKNVSHLIDPDRNRSNIISGEEYKRPVIKELSDGHLVINIYNPDGKNILSTGRYIKKPQFTTNRNIHIAAGPDHDVLVGQMPIYGQNNRQLIGYLQVENNLDAYMQSYHQLALVSILALCLVVIASGLLGYFLSLFLLRPLDGIHDTVKEISADPTKDVRVPTTNRNDELAELITMFNEMLDRMQRYIDQQSQFVSDVSHELRTPVAIIQGHLEMLQRWGKDDPKVLDDSIKATLIETRRMKNLVQEMLDLSRAEQVEINFRNQHTIVNDVVHQVYNNFKMLYPDFTFRLDDDLKEPIMVDIYRDHLEQVLVILCDNAVKYSTDDHKEIHIILSRGMNTVEIGIQDFGEGISPENVKRVFDRFYRVDKARSRKKGGNGLGLSIAKRLIEGYHGSITLESSVGAGSLFRIILPIIEDPETKK